MASIWMMAQKHHAEKLVGNMNPGPPVLHRFKIEVAKAAKRFSADVVYQTQTEALLQPRPVAQGDELVVFTPVALWVEAFSPPSAPEANQPKLLYKDGQPVDGILVTKAGAVQLKVPSNG